MKESRGSLGKTGLMNDGKIIGTVSRYAIIEPEKLNKPEGYPSFIIFIIKES